MARKPRILGAGAVYDVYNRVSSGERLFETPDVAEGFLRLVAEVMGRAAPQVSVWSGEGSRLRREDPLFREEYETLNRDLGQRLAKSRESKHGEKH